MKVNPAFSSLIIALAFGLTACAKNDETPAAPPPSAHADHAMAESKAAPAEPKAAEPTTTAEESAGQTVKVEASDSMRFNVTRIEAKAGSKLTIVFKNAGTLPKNAMGHNFVILKKSANATAFATAAMTSVATEYIPAAMTGDILAHTKLLGPGETDTITLDVPAEAGDYTFLCSFPAHYMAGMKGVLVVTP